MNLKRPSFRRGGSTGIGQLTPNRQMYAGGGNIGGGTIAGSNLGTRTGFESIILQSSGLPYPDSKPSSTYKPNFNLKGSSFTPRNYPLTVIPNVPSGLSRLLAKYPKSVYGGGLTLGAGAGTGIGLLADAYQKATKTPLAYKKLKEVSKRPYYFDETNIDVGEGLDEIRTANEIGEAPGFFPRGGKNKFYEDRGLDLETGLPSKDAVTDDSFAEARIKMTDTPNYVDFNEIVEEVVPNKKDKDDDTPKKEPSFENTYEVEKKRIERLIGDDDDKGMAAIALSEAIGTPGTIADKAAVLNKSLLGIMQGKKKDRKDIAKLAYTATKEIEKAKIAAGKEGFSERQLKDLKRLQRIVNDKTGSYSDAEKKAAQAEINITKQAIDVIGSKKGTEGLTTGDIKVLGNIDALVKEIKRHEGKNDEKYKAALAKFARAKAALQGFAQFKGALAIAEAEIGGTLFKKDGGRIKKQLGGGTETTAMEVSETVGQGETPTAQVQQLSFSELRNRLPKEITDDVIRLLSNSNEALQDFAYIRTQGDVSKFNTKYGVTLVLPAQTA
jgi:hypothetical protein